MAEKLQIGQPVSVLTIKTTPDDLITLANHLKQKTQVTYPGQTIKVTIAKGVEIEYDPELKDTDVAPRGRKASAPPLETYAGHSPEMNQ